MRCCRFTVAGASGRSSFMSSACSKISTVNRLCRQLCVHFVCFGGSLCGKVQIFSWGAANCGFILCFWGVRCVEKCNFSVGETHVCIWVLPRCGFGLGKTDFGYVCTICTIIALYLHVGILHGECHFRRQPVLLVVARTNPTITICSSTSTGNSNISTSSTSNTSTTSSRSTTSRTSCTRTTITLKCMSSTRDYDY